MNASRLPVVFALVSTLALSGCELGGGTPLASAAGAGDLPAMTALLDAGADPNASGRLALSPLAAAARTGKLEAIELLLERGADPHKGSGLNGWTPLLHALHKDQIAAAKRLAATCSAPSPELDRALHMAAGYAQTEAVAALLASGADPRRTFGDGSNALAVAATGSFDLDWSDRGCDARAATVRALLAAAPDLEIDGDAGRSVRRAVDRRGCTELLALLAGR